MEYMYIMYPVCIPCVFRKVMRIHQNTLKIHQNTSKYMSSIIGRRPYQDTNGIHYNTSRYAYLTKYIKIQSGYIRIRIKGNPPQN